MRSLRDISIKHKLTLVIMLTSIVAVLLASLATVAYGLSQLRQAMIRELSEEAEIMAAHSAEALASKDSQALDTILSALRVRPEILLACLYSTNGELVAHVGREAGRQPLIPAMPQGNGHRFEGDHLISFREVTFDSAPIGVLYLRADLREERARLRAYAGLLAVVLLASLFVAMLLSMRLQRIISAPVLALARVARSVTERKDYSLRATKQSNDELGELIDGFNQMLAQIQKRDDALRASEERFRQVTESIREVFWMTDLEKTQMIYISPGYEQIWGRTCASLYASPRDWLEAIHPEDRERVLQAALTKQVRGDYDEEYRIIQPGGAIRWIRDRAFPVRDEQGQIYRMAGIAEDITERKRLEKGIIEISDREQGRIGHDLHDGLCQHLVSIAFTSNLLEQKLAKHSRPEAATAHEISDLLDQAITQARHLARGLYPVKLEAEGLGSALEALASNISKRFNVACVWDYPKPVLVHDKTMATHLYRVAQEAVNNALKHGNAERIRIRLTMECGKIQLVVIDNGLGLSRKVPKTGLGLHIMQYRAAMIGGTLRVEPGPERGTIVSCFCPQESAK